MMGDVEKDLIRHIHEAINRSTAGRLGKDREIRGLKAENLRLLEELALLRTSIEESASKRRKTGARGGGLSE